MSVIDCRGVKISKSQSAILLYDLLFACYYGKTENVHVLLNSNADPNIHNNDNESPLMAAWAKGHVQIVKIMLQVIYICFALISTQKIQNSC